MHIQYTRPTQCQGDHYSHMLQALDLPQRPTEQAMTLSFCTLGGSTEKVTKWCEMDPETG